MAPRDDQAGGSWLGLTTNGMFVGVTNRFPAERVPERESRGTLVLEALRAPSAQALRARLEGLSPTRFNTFHLLYGDRQQAFVSWSDGARVQHQELTPGLHVITERSLGGDDHGRAQRIFDAWPTLESDAGVPSARALQSLLGQTNPADPAGGVCVDLPEWNFGTRSSLVLRVAPKLSDSRWWWADGRPDQVPFVEHPELIAQLFAS